MGTRILRAEDRPSQPWQNGLGSTSEIIMWPPGSTHGTFDWRVSIAEMAVEAEFSRLPGIDRTLVALGGDGIRLTIDGRFAELAEFESVSFAGESAVRGGPRQGATRDLNLMVRRGTPAATLRVISTPGVHDIDVGDSELILAVIAEGEGALTGHDAEPGSALTLGDGVLVRGPDRVRIETSGVLIMVTGAGVPPSV